MGYVDYIIEYICFYGIDIWKIVKRCREVWRG